MRGVALAFVLLLGGCATSVQRLDGEVKTPAGPAKTPCEQRSWLLVAPTRTEYAEPGDKHTHKRDDALGLYRVGGASPESIPALAGELPASPMVERHTKAAHDYDTQRITAGILGAAGVAAIAVGTIVFINSFETTTRTNSTGGTSEEHSVAGGRAALGGVLIGVGFGLGIGGIVVSPSQADRARGDSARYTFLPPDDAPGDVSHLVAEHNEKVRGQCSAGKATAAGSERR